MGAVSQWEREAIGERPRDALRHKKSNGQRVGNIAYGYRLEGDGVHVDEDPGEQAVVAEIRRLRELGTSLRKIATMLNELGYRTRRGTEWRLESAARVLKCQPNRISGRALLTTSPMICTTSEATGVNQDRDH